MKRRSTETAVLQVILIWPGSVVLGIAAWYLSLFVLMRVCDALYEDAFVALFGNHHLGIFATIVPWLPVAAGGFAALAPWGLLAVIEIRRKVSPGPEKNIPHSN
jgi:hypothetical protein